MAAEVLEQRLLGGAAESERRLPPASIAQVYEANFKYVWRCLRSLGVRDPLLDDAVQDVFLVVQRRLPEFDGRADLRTWLYAIALRVARRYRARAAKDAHQFVPAAAAPGLLESADGRVETPVEAGGAIANLEHDVELGQRLELARRALEALDDAKREVFVLAFVEQMSAPEIAETTGLPLNTVYSRMRAARQAFSAQVARLEPFLARRSR